MKALPEDKSRDIVSSDTQLRLMQTVGSVISHYQTQITSFADELHTINEEITLLKEEIRRLLDTIKSKQATLRSLENDVNAEMKYLEKLHERFMKKADILNALVQIRSDDELQRDLPNRKKEIYELLEEIDESELTVLELELQVQNQTIIIQPDLQRHSLLQSKLDELEARKHYLETVGLHRLHGGTFTKPHGDNDDEITDTDVVEK